jgi:hypothetical protein
VKKEKILQVAMFDGVAFYLAGVFCFLAFTFLLLSFPHINLLRGSGAP